MKKETIYIRKQPAGGNCPNCNKHLDGLSGPDRLMEEDDITICLYCHSILRVYINNGIKFKLMDEEDLQITKMLDPELYKSIQEMLSIVKEIKL